MMSTTAPTPATTPIPVQLSELEFTAFILPHLSMPKRGPKCKLDYYRVFNLILWVLVWLKISAVSTSLKLHRLDVYWTHGLVTDSNLRNGYDPPRPDRHGRRLAPTPPATGYHLSHRGKPCPKAQLCRRPPPPNDPETRRPPPPPHPLRRHPPKEVPT